MDHQSVSQYLDKRVKITLSNGFWYRAKIIKVSENTVQLIEERGRIITVTPEAITILEELS